MTDTDRRAGLSPALCQYRGMLVLFAVKPAKHGKGQCPDCGGTLFRDGAPGWLECDNDCGFAVLKSHVMEE